MGGSSPRISQTTLPTVARRDKLKELLLAMIEHEVGDSEKYAIPDEPPVPKGAKGFAVNVRELGPVTKKRREHEEDVVERNLKQWKTTKAHALTNTRTYTR